MKFYLQHGAGTEAVEVREDWKPQPRRGTVVACRFKVKVDGRWYRLYADSARGIAHPHFINLHGKRVAVTGVCP